MAERIAQRDVLRALFYTTVQGTAATDRLFTNDSTFPLFSVANWQRFIGYVGDKALFDIPVQGLLADDYTV